MRKTQLDRYRNRLLEFRARLNGTIENMLKTVLTDAMPAEEHDRIVSEGPDKELLLEHDEEIICREVTKALERVERGDYGICQECGEPIGLPRLEVMPYTPYCVGCERKVEAG